MSDDEPSIDGKIRQQLISTVRPVDFQTVDALRATEAEVRTLVHRRHESPVRCVVDVLLLSAGGENQLRPNSRGLLAWRLADELDLQVMMCVVAWCDVLVDEGGAVDVVHDEIQPAVVVEIGVCRAVGVSRLPESPLFARVGEGKVAIVAEDVGRLLVIW